LVVNVTINAHLTSPRSLSVRLRVPGSESDGGRGILKRLMEGKGSVDDDEVDELGGYRVCTSKECMSTAGRLGKVSVKVN